MNRPEATDDLVIYFTPRSGSSWLTQALQSHGSLGRAGEFFNPNFIPNIAGKMGASTLDEYTCGARRKLQKGGVFSFEITYYQLKRVFEEEEVFLQYFGGARSAWLIRRDIVAQAVSLAKKDRTKIGHSTQLKDKSKHETDSVFEYDVDHIRKWLKHIHTAEVKTERFMSRFGISPLRISYEGMMGKGAIESVGQIARHLDRDDLSVLLNADLPEKLGTSQNEEYAERFRKDASREIQEIEDRRGPWIDLLQD